MQFDSGDIESKPHAYVVFDDTAESKETVPLSFVKDFPVSWRKTGWDKDYKFKVFWSPDPSETPGKMLSKVVKVPVMESGTSHENAGYYRAGVLAVQGEFLRNGFSSKIGPFCSHDGLMLETTLDTLVSFHEEPYV
jgi:hypothetical protein